MNLLVTSVLAMALLDPDVNPTPSGSTGPQKTGLVKPTPTKADATFEGMSTPESVLVDADADVYLVSNINGAPLAKDNNGFISVVTADGKATKLIEGGKNKATLNAPKGMALVGGVLYVTDIDTVRMFDRKTGAPKGELAVAGASFLNDLAVSPDGKTLYFTDSGLKMGADLEPSGTDAVYAIKGGKVTTLLKDKDLGKPNGLIATADTLWIVNFGNNDLWSIDLKTSKKGAKATALPKASLDGIAMLPSGELLISSWEGTAIFRGKPGGEFKEVISGVSAPADIAYDAKRSQVIVPRFQDNKVEAFAVPK